MVSFRNACFEHTGLTDKSPGIKNKPQSSFRSVQSNWRQYLRPSVVLECVVINKLPCSCLPGHCPDGTYDASKAHPDNDECVKLKSLVAFGEYTAEHLHRELYFWVDHLSIDQNNIQPGIRSLPLYVTSCSSLVVAYSSNYASWAWTLLEQCLFTAISTKPALTAISCDGTFFSNMRSDKNGVESRKVLANPCNGALSDESDRPTIARLVQTAEEVLHATKWDSVFLLTCKCQAP